jgi:hypothetical protein
MIRTLLLAFLLAATPSALAWDFNGTEAPSRLDEMVTWECRCYYNGAWYGFQTVLVDTYPGTTLTKVVKRATRECLKQNGIHPGDPNAFRWKAGWCSQL